MRLEIHAWLVIFVALVFSLAFSARSEAEYISQSDNYQLDEGIIGSNNILDSSSTNYKAIGSLGGGAVGESSSTNFQTQGGGQTSPDPNLSLIVNTSPTNFGNFSPISPSTATATFSVINYTSYGYSVYIVGDTPSNNGYSLPAMTADVSTSDAESIVGTEQFGINLVANTDPSVGQNLNNGSPQFGFGQVSSNYNNPNHFYYESGTEIARALKSSGQTTYTISYLVNVEALTPGGAYTASQSLIVVGTY